MDVETLRDYCLSLKGVTEKMPFGKFAKRYDSILVFYVREHMFCFMDVDNFTYVTVKSTPEEIDEIKACHMSVSKPLNQCLRHWIQLDLGGDVADTMVYELINRAYAIVERQYAPKRRKSNGSAGKESHS